MASQPLNTGIKIYRTLRGQRGLVRHESVKAITSKQRTLELQVAGQERPEVYALTRDANTKGVTSYDALGRPVVIGARAVKNFNVVERLTGVTFPVEIGHDKFVENTAAGLASDTAGGDLQKQSRTV